MFLYLCLYLCVRVIHTVWLCVACMNLITRTLHFTGLHHKIFQIESRKNELLKREIFRMQHIFILYLIFNFYYLITTSTNNTMKIRIQGILFAYGHNCVVCHFSWVGAITPFNEYFHFIGRHCGMEAEINSVYICIR